MEQRTQVEDAVAMADVTIRKRKRERSATWDAQSAAGTSSQKVALNLRPMGASVQLTGHPDLLDTN